MLSIKDDVVGVTEEFHSTSYHVLFRTDIGKSEHMLHFTSSFNNKTSQISAKMLQTKVVDTEPK